jgi:hypothetical protein
MILSLASPHAWMRRFYIVSLLYGTNQASGKVSSGCNKDFRTGQVPKGYQQHASNKCGNTFVLVDHFFSWM